MATFYDKNKMVALAVGLEINAKTHNLHSGGPSKTGSQLSGKTLLTYDVALLLSNGHWDVLLCMGSETCKLTLYYKGNMAIFWWTFNFQPRQHGF